MPQDPTNSQDPLDKLNGDGFVPPHEVIGAAADKFAPLASTAQDPDEVADAPVMGDRLARQEEYAAQEEEAEVARLDEESGMNAAIEAIDAVNAEAALEAQQAPVLRSTESERRVADALYGSLDPNELTPEELAMFDVEVEETKRRAAKPEMVSGTMTEEKDSLLGQAADLQEGAMGEIGQAIRSVGLDEDGFTEEEGVEKYGWVDGIEIDRNVNTPETEMFDAFYEAMKADDVLDNMGMVNSHTLTNFMSRYAIEISDGEVTPSQRTHMMTMISKGLAQRNGLELQGRPFSEEQMTSRMGMVDLAAGLGIYHDMESGRIASLRYGREGAIPYTDAQQKKREDRIRAHGVYDAGVKSHYRTGDTYEEIHPTEGWDSFTSWWGEMGRTAFDKMGVGLESRYSRPSATMAGYVANVLVGATSGHGALKATGVLGDLAKVSRRLPTVVKWVNIENSAAVTDYYMQTQGKQAQTWQGAVDDMSRTGQLKQLIEEYPSWEGVINWAEKAAKESRFIITGDDDQDAAALKQMGSGLLISLPIGAAVGGVVKLAPLAYGLVFATKAKPSTAAKAVTGVAKQIAPTKFSQEAIEKAAKDLGHEPQSLWKAYNEAWESMNFGSERGAVGGGKLPQFGRGADEPKFYHGTGSEIDMAKVSEDATDVRGLYGHGVYLTDSQEVAEGYAKARGKKTGVENVYDVDISDANLIDLDAKATADHPYIVGLRSMAESFDHSGYFVDVDAIFKNVEDVSFADVYKRFRDELVDNNVNTSDAMEGMQYFTGDLAEQGFDGLTHVGGKQTGGKPHKVAIIFQEDYLPDSTRVSPIKSWQKAGRGADEGKANRALDAEAYVDGIFARQSESLGSQPKDLEYISHFEEGSGGVYMEIADGTESLSLELRELIAEVRDKGFDIEFEAKGSALKEVQEMLGFEGKLFAPTTRAGQEGFLNLDPSNLWAQGKRFLKNLKSLPKQTAESTADAKASRATLKALEKNMSPEELAAAKELAASDEPIRTIAPLDEAMGEGRASGTYAEGRTQVHRDADDWNRSLHKRIEAFEDVTTLRKLDPSQQLDEEAMRLLRRYGVEPEHGKLSQDDIDMAIDDAGSSGARAETKEAEWLAEIKDKYGINMDKWGDHSRGRYDKDLRPNGETLEEFLRKEGFEPNRPDTPDGGVRPDYPEEMAEWGKLKDDALSKFLIARKNYKMEKEAKSLSAETKSKLEYYGVRLQQVLAEGDELIGRKVMNRAIATRSYVLPDLNDAEAVRKWSIKNYNTGLYTHADWYNITANWRMGQSFGGETGKQASEALEVYFNSTGGLKKREFGKFSMRQLAANTREAKTGTNITALGTQFAAAQGMPVGVGRMALQPAVEGIFRGLWKESDIARMGALAERLRNGETLSPDPRIMPREAAELDDDGLKHGAWNRAINFVFNPMADVNIDMGGMKATGEIGAGYKGTMKLFGQERDLQSASPLAVRALSMEDGLLRNVASGVVGAGQAVGRHGMGRIDRVTKKINFDRELSRQVASAFLHQKGNTKRIKDGLALNEQELVEIYSIFKDARHAIEDGELLEHEVKKFLRDNLEGIYKDGEKVQKIHSGYSNDELIDTAMGAWKATQERQRELTLQQDLPFSWAEVQGVSIGEGIKGTSQMPVVGQFAMYLPTIVNNFSMGAERLPVVGALYDMFALRGVKSPRGIKNLSPVAKAEIVEKQVTGAWFVAAAGALYGATNLIDRFQLNSDGELEMWVETDKASIRENLRLRLSENPDFVSSAMDGANKRLSMEADMAGTVAKQWDDPTEYLDSELLDKFIIKSENGRSKIKVPRLGWTGSLLVSAITFFKGMEDVKDLPLEMIASEGMLDRLHTLTRGQLKAVQAHEMADGYKKMFGMFDDGTTIEATTDMLLAEMASPLTLWKGATSTSGEPLEFESELTKDYRAVSGLEEFMEAGGAVSIPRVMNHVWGDKHISRRFNGMGQNVLRPQRYLSPTKGSLMVEYKHETDFIEEMIREAKIVIKPIQHTSLMPDQSSDVSTYDYRNADGETMYEAVVYNMNSVVPPNGIEQDDGSVTYPTYIDSLNTYRASASYKKLQAQIDLGLAAQDRDDFRDESGMITDKDVLAAMVAQAYVAEHLKAYRDAYKDLSAIDFLANGGGEDYKHKDTDESFTDVYNKSIALDYAGSVRLATEFALEGDEAFEYQDLSVKELQAVVGESMATELERVKGSLAQ